MQVAEQIRLEIPSSTEYVSLVRHAVEGIAHRMRFDEPEINDLKLAVGEACTNAVRHGCPSEAHPFVTVVCKVNSGCLEIEVCNSLAGGESCPTIVGSLDDNIENRKEGGMGLYIMRSLMDEVDIIWGANTARIRMVKRPKHGH